MTVFNPDIPYTPRPSGYTMPPSPSMIEIPGVPGGGFNPSYRLPDGSVVSKMELNRRQRERQVLNARQFGEALRQMAAQNSAAPMVGQVSTAPIEEIDKAYGRVDPLTRVPVTSKPFVPYGGTGMAPVAKVISSLGRSVAAPFSTAFSGKKINVGTGGAPMVNVFRSMFGK
jgi:hypothetical protein